MRSQISPVYEVGGRMIVQLPFGLLPFPFPSFLMTLYVRVSLRKSQNSKTGDVLIRVLFVWILREDWKMGLLVLCSDGNTTAWIFLFSRSNLISRFPMSLGNREAEADRLVRDQCDKFIEEKNQISVSIQLLVLGVLIQFTASELFLLHSIDLL